MADNYYKKGDWNAICDVCGQKFKASELRRRWDNLRVCPDDFEERHPQDFLKGKKDDQSVPWARPEAIDREVPYGGINPDDPFGTPLTEYTPYWWQTSADATLLGGFHTIYVESVNGPHLVNIKDDYGVDINLELPTFGGIVFNYTDYGLTAPVTFTFARSIADDPDVDYILISIGATGVLPVISQFSKLTRAFFDDNFLTGTLPDISSHPLMDRFTATGAQQLTGNIPDLSNCPSLQRYYVSNTGSGLLTGFSGGVPPTLTQFNANSNSLTQTAVDNLLQAFVDAGASNGVLNLTFNTAPSATGYANVTTLQGRGWTVLTD